MYILKKNNNILILLLFVIIKANNSLPLTIEKTVENNIGSILLVNNITFKISGIAVETFFEGEREDVNISLSIYDIKKHEKEININNKEEAKNIIKEIKNILKPTYPNIKISLIVFQSVFISSNSRIQIKV